MGRDHLGPPQTQPHVRDRGAATLEQLGVVVVVGLLFSAAVLGVANYSPYLSNALCQVASGLGLSAGSCDAGTTPVAEDDALTDEDFLPPVCLLRETSNQVSSEVKIAFITIGNDAGFVIAEHSDGTVTVTATNGGALGAEGGVGADIGSGDYGIGAKVDFGGGLTFGVGDSWQFESMDDWTAVEKQLNDYLVQQEVLRWNPEAAIGLLIMDAWAEAPSDPAVTAVTIGLEGSISANAGLQVNHGTKPDGKTNWYNPNLGLYASGSLGGEVTQTVNNVTGEVSETMTFTADGSVGANLGIANAGGEGSYQSAYKITQDGEGNITKIEFMQETSGQWTAEIDLDTGLMTQGESNNSGSVQIGADRDHQHTVVTTTLDVTDSNREIVDEWLAGNAQLAAETGSPAFYYPANAFNPSEPVEGDPFAQLLYEESRNSTQIYDNVTDGFSFGAEFALGLKFGASFSSEENVATISSAYFLGAPTADGTRGLLEDATCVMP